MSHQLHMVWLLSALLLLCVLTGCGGDSANNNNNNNNNNNINISEDTERNASFFAMDTYMNLRVFGGQADTLEKAEALVAGIEAEVSTTDAQSAIYTLNHTGHATLSAPIAALVEQTLALCQDTQGALDISVYPIVQAWGFTTSAYHVPTQAEIDALLPLVDYTQITLNADTGSISLPDGMEIDLGAVTKGYTGDAICELLRADGVTHALLDMGGNIQSIGYKPNGNPWRVAIQHPEGNGLLGVIDSHDEAVITSGGYERYFEEDGKLYWHIMDPATGTPAQNGILSATIVGPQGLVCDALSTAQFIQGETGAIAYWRAHQDFDMVLVTDDGRMLITESLYARFTPDPAQPYTVEVLHAS